MNKALNQSRINRVHAIGSSRQLPRSRSQGQQLSRTQHIASDVKSMAGAEQFSFESELVINQKGQNTNTPNDKGALEPTPSEPNDAVYLDDDEQEQLKSAAIAAEKDCTSTLSQKSSTAEYSGASNPGSVERRVQQPSDVKLTHSFNSGVPLSAEGVSSNLKLTASWPEIRKQVCNSIAKWVQMCDGAEHTVTLMKQACPSMFGVKSPLVKADTPERHQPLTEVTDLTQTDLTQKQPFIAQKYQTNLTEQELTDKLIEYFKVLEKLTPCEYQESCIYALILIEQSFSRSLFIHSQTVERFCAIMYGFAYKNLSEIDRVGLNLQLGALTQLSLKEFNQIESQVFRAFDYNLNVTEEYFLNKVAAFEKAAAADAVTQDKCSESGSSMTSDQLFTSDDQNADNSIGEHPAEERLESSSEQSGQNGGEHEPQVNGMANENMVERKATTCDEDELSELEITGGECEACDADVKIKSKASSEAHICKAQSVESESVDKESTLEGTHQSAQNQVDSNKSGQR